MCPKRFIEEDVHKPLFFELPTVYKMEVGKIIHEMLQNEALLFDYKEMETLLEDISEAYLTALDTYIGYMYKRETKGCKDLLWERPRDLGEMLEKKLEKAWPEVPGFCPESGFSFRSDLTLNIDNEPVIVDIKTTSVLPHLWEKHKETLPLPEHILQTRFYRHFFNLHNYYNKKINKTGLAYVNLLMPTGSEGSEHEVYQMFKEGPDLEIELLIKHLIIHRSAWLYDKENKYRECTYPSCKEHGKGNIA